MKSNRKARMIRNRIIVFVIASALLFLLISAVTVGALFLSVKLPSVSFAEEYSVCYGSENEKVSKMDSASYKFGQFGDHDTVYTNFTALADYCGFYISGDDTTLRYILPAHDGSEDSQFAVTAGSSEIKLNGTSVYLSAPAVMVNGDLYLPIEFIDLYIQGITVSVDEKDPDTYILRCSNQSAFYLIASEQTPSSPIDRSALEGADVTPSE